MAPSIYKLNNVSPSELKPGFMRECEVEGVDDAKVLLLQYGKNLRATNTHCTHYNLPLVKGCLTEDGRVICPFHGSCFRVGTGDIEDGPALDALHSFPVNIDGETVTIEADASKIKAGRRTPDMTEISPASDDSKADVLIVGGGSGSVGVIEGLRQKGYKGPITILSKESYPPIDRTKLSKALITDAGKVALRDAEFYKKFGVTMHNSTIVKSVDFEKHTVTTDKDQHFTYRKLILATGGTPRKLPLEGFKTLSNIFVLRTVDDVRDIMQVAGENGGKKIVVVGSAFIGLEVANALAGKKHEVVVIGMEESPMERVVGKKIGATFQKLLEKKMRFAMSATVDRAEPRESDGNRVGSVVLKDGTKFEADLVVCGVGVAPETTYLDKSLLEKDGSLLVDENYQIKGQSDAYAIGDIATYPYKGQMVRIEHFSVAQNSGRSAGIYIATGKLPHPFMPIFWSALGVQLRYCGYGGNYDDIVIQGTLKDDPKFAAFFTKGQDVTAVATMQKDPVMVFASELMRVGAMPSKKELEDGLDITTLSVPPLQV